VGDYVYGLTAENMLEGGEAHVSVVVDRITVSECGGSSFYTGQEGVAWYRLRSEFDGQPVTIGAVTLSDGGKAVWNPGASRWEYIVSSDEEGTLTLIVESVIWSKYGVSSLTPETMYKEAVIQWVQPPFYYPLVMLVQQMYTFFLWIPPLAWVIIGIVFVFALLMKLGIIEVVIETEEKPAEEPPQE